MQKWFSHHLVKETMLLMHRQASKIHLNHHSAGNDFCPTTRVGHSACLVWSKESGIAEAAGFQVQCPHCAVTKSTAGNSVIWSPTGPGSVTHRPRLSQHFRHHQTTSQNYSAMPTTAPLFKAKSGHPAARAKCPKNLPYLGYMHLG